MIITIFLDFSKVNGVENRGFPSGSDHVGLGRTASLPIRLSATGKKWFGVFPGVGTTTLLRQRGGYRGGGTRLGSQWLG